MGDSHFSCDEVFDDDYLYFHQPHVDGEVARDEAEFIADLLELEPGQRVLDLGCGHGRIALALGELGYRVTGIDRAAEYVAAGRAQIADRHLGDAVVLECGDMRQLHRPGQFDGAVCWFSTLGYHDDDTERDILRRLRGCLVPGGRLVVEHVHRDAWLENFRSGRVLERNGDLLLDRHRYCSASRRLEGVRTILRGGRRRQVRFSVRLWDGDELCAWLGAAGFDWVELLDDVGEPWAPGADRMVALAGRD